MSDVNPKDMVVVEGLSRNSYFHYLYGVNVLNDEDERRRFLFLHRSYGSVEKEV